MSVKSQRTILLVEDNEDDRRLLRRLLREADVEYTIVDARSGEEGLELARQGGVDLLLLDYYLPDFTGDEFLAELRAGAGRSPLLPVAVLTGHEEGDTARRVLAHGAVDYLVKGTLTGPGLARAIENAVERHAIQCELEENRAELEMRNYELEMLRDEMQRRLLDLADAHRAKDQFMAIMSHEMRTPLNAILGYADLLDFGLGGDLSEAQRLHVDRIRVGGRHLLDLINDVLDLARADARKLELDLRPVDVETAVEEVVALLESQAEVKGLRLALEPSPVPLPPVEADLQRLRQVLTNLVGNAIKFTEEGSVTVSCAQGPDGGVRVRIRDTGIGIDPTVLPLVFNEFYQAEGELTRQHGGSGLGLAISQRLARLMGGDVVAESKLGEGSTFTLSLRLAGGTPVRPEEISLESSAAVLLEAGPTSSTVVAFGDDSLALAALAERVLPGVRLVWTTDPEQVPALARRERATLVVLEIASRNGAAWRAAHAMTEVPELANTAVLLLPAIPAADATESGGIDLGWVSLVPKPFTSEQLTHAVARAAHTGRDPLAPATDHHQYAVLVVDDDEDSRRVATRFLTGPNVTVHHASDGESALVTMRRTLPDVVVLDLMMPVLDGFGVLATMRADPMLARVPVVVLSAKTLTQAEREFLSRTAVRVLQKGEHRLADVAALVLRAAGAGASPPPRPRPA